MILMRDTKPFFLRQQMVDFLDTHGANELYDLVEGAIERKAVLVHGNFDTYMKLYSTMDTHIKYHPLPKPSNISIQRMEENCLWLKKTLQNINLNHKERLYLTIIYLRLGKMGKKRLYEIFATQQNYNERITKQNIEGFAKKGKSYGVSCEKLVNMRLCKEKECKTWQNLNQ